jgi:hypothetical protein
VIALLLGPIRTGGGQEDVAPYGIWAQNQTLIVFAHVYPRPPNGLTPPGVAQIFVSDDGGRRWNKRGPDLDGSEFQFIRAVGDRLCVVGEHTVEGPVIEPFIFVPSEKGLKWTMHVIYEGAADSEGIAATRDGGFSAWIRHLNLHRDGWTGPLYAHKRGDGGLTWRAVRLVKKSPGGPRTRIQSDRETDGELAGVESSQWRLRYRTPRRCAF